MNKIRCKCRACASYHDLPGVKKAARAEALRRQCLRALHKRNMTADEVARAVRRCALSVRPRMSELFAQRKILKTEKRRKNASGHSAVVWVAAPLAIAEMPHAKVAKGTGVRDKLLR